jgi:uncharacterized protein YbjT (DUF2867 family)
MTTYLVAGATGQLGRPTLEELRRRGLDARGMSRRGGRDTIGADLLTGEGISDALRGVDVVVHCATTGSSRDLKLAQNLTAAAVAADVRHLVLISIVGIDRIPFAFYRDRLRIEEVVRESGVPSTIQRATQFHSFVDRFFSSQRRMPVVLAPSVRVQPIDVEDVAVRLADLASAEPAGRVGDIGGPEVRDVGELGKVWRRAAGARGRIVPVRLPGRLFAALRRGENLVPGPAFGSRTFEHYLSEKYTAPTRSPRA